ncbi:MAG: DoxX protein, partial [Flavobacteriaceae bacterium]
APIEVVEKAEKFKAPEKESTLQKILYISGAKQTGYFWQVLGICELLFGLLVLLQGTSFVGAVFLLPITLHIFLFHLFLEADELGELLQTGGFLAINIALVLKEKAKWKHLLWIKPV